MTKWDDRKDVLSDLIKVRKTPYEEIGRMFGCSGNNIKKVARRLGIELERRRKAGETETFNRGCGATSTCLNCGAEFNGGSGRKFCSNGCQQQYQYRTYIEGWRNGDHDGLSGEYGISRHIRRYLFEKNGCRCEMCGWGERNLFTGNVPLEVHHIDGDYTNNREENLQLLCPNCHSLTDTFKNHNGNGRKGRKKYR
jgi:hypothetical protein